MFFLIGDGPDPEEVLLAIRVNDTKIALKSGFEKYLRVEKDGVIRGIADAVGSMEQWEPIFEVKETCSCNMLSLRILSGLLIKRL